MDNFKKELFEQDYPGKEFPHYRTLMSSEVETIRAVFGQKLNIAKWDKSHLVWLSLFDNAEKIGNYDLSAPGFQLEHVFQAVSLKHGETVYIDWADFHQIDAMSFNEFAEYFDDIYYNDEVISLFDETMSWIMFLVHYGDVKIVYA